MNNGKTLIMLVYDVNNSFIINELKFYDQHKIPVRLYTRSTHKELGFESIYIDVITITDNAISEFSLGIRNATRFLWVSAYEIFRNLRNPGYLKQAWKEIMAGLQSLKTALFIRSIEKSSANKIFYSYWFYHEATALSWLTKIKFIDGFISRAHGFDVFDELRPFAVMPYRIFQLKNVLKVFTVSKDGANYLKNKYKNYSYKIFTNYLGVFNDYEFNNTPPKDFRLISCGAVQFKKRTNLILDVLKNMPDIEWTHIGDGPQMSLFFNDISDFTGKINILGKLENHLVYQELSKSHSVFISLSESEGIPVSIMEAISFGIPVIATDAGGCREIVNPETGMLIPVDFDEESLKTILNEFRESAMNSPEFREGVHRFWQNNFNAENNYKAFINKLM
jgi:glycosyltransferase involved in cell wall biosynthesis